MLKYLFLFLFILGLPVFAEDYEFGGMVYKGGRPGETNQGLGRPGDSFDVETDQKRFNPPPRMILPPSNNIKNESPSTPQIPHPERTYAREDIKRRAIEFLQTLSKNSKKFKTPELNTKKAEFVDRIKTLLEKVNKEDSKVEPDWESRRAITESAKELFSDLSNFIEELENNHADEIDEFKAREIKEKSKFLKETIENEERNSGLK